ncbi:MAG: histidine phosphatase family protein [Cyclobacteriaceae bacterium]|nr:histidine phosphatase family protein [Cyclobacteriaceae bacterium]
MTRTIYLIRHAEAATKKPIQTDLQRELTPTGKQDAQMAGVYLKSKSVIFDLVLCSLAVRTHTTAQLITINMSDPSTDVIIEPSIYHATDDDLFTILCNVPISKKSVALVGHNPAISWFASSLTKSKIETFDPCTMAAFQFDVEKWADLRLQTGCLEFIHSPSIF